MSQKLTAEQHEQIVSLYLSGLSIHQIASVIDCAFQTVSKHLKKAGIETRERSVATKMGRNYDAAAYLEICLQPKLERVDTRAEDRQRVMDLYQSGRNITEIHKSLGPSRNTVKSWLNKSEIQQRTRGDSCRRHTLNQAVFDEIDTDAKAYWLGFLTADGYISPQGDIRISLQLRDQGHLESFRAFLETTTPVRIEKSIRGYSTKPACYIAVSSHRLSENLAKHGIGPRKTETLCSIPNLPKALYGAYVRGVFDGDGTWCIARHVKSSLAWRLYGNRKHLLLVQDLMMKILGLSRTKLADHHTTPYVAALTYGGTRQVAKIARWMYSEATMHLPRKTFRFVEHLRRHDYSDAEDFEVLMQDA